MRLRRSYSTPSETWPATRRRDTLNVRRSSAGGRDGDGQGPQVAPPLSISSTVRPTSRGMSTPAPIAAAARTKETPTPRL